MRTYDRPLTADNPLFWLEEAGLDPLLKRLDNFASHWDPIRDGDTRAYCQAQVGQPGFEHLCKNRAKDGRYCNLPAHRRQGAEQ